MDNSKFKKQRARKARVLRVRKKLIGTASIPRMSVSKTNAHLYVQLIDDVKAVTVGGIGTLSKGNQKTSFNGKSKAAARHLGSQIAEIAKKQNIERVIFDRGRYKFHGIIAELAAGAREAGLQF